MSDISDSLTYEMKYFCFVFFFFTEKKVNFLFYFFCLGNITENKMH